MEENNNRVHIKGLITHINFNKAETCAIIRVAARENNNMTSHFLRVKVDKERLEELKKVKADIDQNIQRPGEEFKPTFHSIDAEGARVMKEYHNGNGVIHYVPTIIVKTYAFKSLTARFVPVSPKKETSAKNTVKMNQKQAKTTGKKNEKGPKM